MSQELFNLFNVVSFLSRFSKLFFDADYFFNDGVRNYFFIEEISGLNAYFKGTFSSTLLI